MRSMRVLAALMFAAVLSVGAAGCKDAMAPSILANMGGMDGVAKFLDNWTASMSADANLAKALTSDDMSMITRGFTNEVAKASDIPMPNAGVDLKQVIKDKAMTNETLTGVRNALITASGTSKLSPDAAKGALALWDGVAK